jgi:hypothetical protein
VVIANPLAATASNFFVVTGPDGHFDLDTLTPGTYTVYPMVGSGGGRPKDMYIRVVDVVAGSRASVDIDIVPGDISLEVAVEADSGPPVAMAQLFVIGLDVDAPTAEYLRNGAWLQTHGARDRAVPFYLRTAMGGPVTIEGLRPGKHTACAIPLPIDPNDPQAVMAMRSKMEQLPMKCVPVPVASSPSAQKVTVVVPAEWMR